MSINIGNLLPALAPAVEGVANTPLIRQINEIAWIFAVVETGHLLFLVILGGAVFGLNLRLLGLILPDLSARDVEQALRRWYHIGVVGTVVTGVAMGLTVARTLLPSGAFFIKMVALLAAILLSHVVASQARTGRARVSENALLGAAILLWGGALFLFASTEGLNSGAMLIGLAGAGLLAMASQRRHRPLVVGISTIALGLWFVGLDGILGPERADLAKWGGNGIILAAVVPALGIGVCDLRTDSANGDMALKLAAFASTLAWVTVAAAGRWIGFS
jgi:hypothetical protein